MSASAGSTSIALPAALSASRSHAFRIGIALAVANIVICACQPGLTRWGATNLDPLLFCTGAATVAAACCIPFMYARGELGLLFGPRFRSRLAAVSMIGTVASSVLLTFGLTRIGAIAGTLLLQTEPIYSLILAIAIIGERPSLRQIAATGAILAGIASVFSTGTAFSPVWAAALVFLTPLCSQSSHVMALKLMPPLSPICVTSGRMIYAALGLGVVLLATRPTTIGQLANPAAIGIVAFTGVAVYFLSSITWYGAISRLSLAWTTALVVPGIPVLSILFAMLFLGEQPTRRELIGIAIAILGVLALVLGADAHRKLPDSEAAEAIHQPIT